MEPDLRVDIGGVVLNNPVMTASGTFGYGLEFAPLMDLNRLGGIIVKGLSARPAAGNPPPRLVETTGGMLNAIGLENIGIDAFLRDKLPDLSTLGTPLWVNIWGNTVEDYARVAARVDPVEAIAGVEVNISCPNITAGGVTFGVDPGAASTVVVAVRRQTSKPLMVKLSPNVTDIGVIVRAVEDAGADAISLINTLTAMAIDVRTRRSRLANVTGGLSGPAVKPVALHMVWRAAQATRLPVVGLGGIVSAEDALEFLVAGASAVQIGTGNFLNPCACVDIIDGLRRFLMDNRIARVADLVGTLRV